VQVKDSAQALLTVREVAAVLRLDVSTVYRIVARGTIGGVQFGPRSTVRIPRRELDQLLTGSPIATAGEATASSSRIRGLEVKT
jgi:excisionase family DNA binding protein